MAYTAITPDFLEQMIEEGLSPNARLVELALLTCHDCNVIGVFTYNEPNLIRITGLQPEEIPPIIAELEQKHRIRLKDGYILIRSKWTLRLNPASKKTFYYAEKAFSSLPPPVANLFNREHPDFDADYKRHVLQVPLTEDNIAYMTESEFAIFYHQTITNDQERERISNLYGTPEYFQSKKRPRFTPFNSN